MNLQALESSYYRLRTLQITLASPPRARLPDIVEHDTGLRVRLAPHRMRPCIKGDAREARLMIDSSTFAGNIAERGGAPAAELPNRPRPPHRPVKS